MLEHGHLPLIWENALETYQQTYENRLTVFLMISFHQS